jgi:multiple sugar transport system substrate-binding protein
MGTYDHPMSRRTLLRGAGLIGLGGVLSGCGTALASGVAGTGPPGNTLSYWNLLGGGDGTRMQAMQQVYQKQHPNIALDAVVLAWGNPYYTKVSLATLGQRPPDVAISHLTRASILAQAGLLEPLNENELAPYGLTGNHFTPTAWSMAHTNGTLYAIRSIRTRW